MRQKTGILAAVALAGLLGLAWAEDWPRWRGPRLDGLCQEKGLLKQWPPEGPRLLWTMNGLGVGY